MANNSTREDIDSMLSPETTPFIYDDPYSVQLPTPNIDRRLYISHFLSTWNSRMFEFGAVLFLAAIFPDSLLEMSVYALVRACSAIVLAPAVGNYIDTGNRLQVLTVSIVGQRVAVAASCIGFWVLKADLLPSFGAINIRQLILSWLILLACVEKLCSIMNTISMERDWVVIVAESDTSRLQALNARMRQIDLSCKLVGPLVIAVFDGLSTVLAILMVLGMTVVSLPVEYLAIAKVYNIIPALHVNGCPPSPTDSDTPNSRLGGRLATYLRTMHAALLGYIHHSAFMPSFSISILYLTVLNFAGQMVAYLLSVGYTSTQIGLLRTVSVVFEISATLLAPLAMRKVGPTRAGLWFVNWQMICIAVAASCFWGVFGGNSVVAWGFVAGVIASRMGLWGFDLCVQILVQDEVEPTFRGSFSSVEASLQNFFELCSYALTIIYARPSEFGYPILFTVVSIFVAGGLYTRFVRKRRGHLFHVSCCEKPRRAEQETAE